MGNGHARQPRKTPRLKPLTSNAFTAASRQTRLSGQKVCLGNYSTEYGYAVLWWNSDHVSPLPHSTGSMLRAGFPE